MIRIPPRRRRTVTSEEHSLWRTVMRDTEPLPGRELDGEPELPSLLTPEPVQLPAPIVTAPAGRSYRSNLERFPCPSRSRQIGVSTAGPMTGFAGAVSVSMVGSTFTA